MKIVTENINNIPTEIITFNGWAEEAKTAKDIVLVITGIPGLPSFYKEFAQVIQSKIPSDIPIWIIGHTGHTKLPENSQNLYPDAIANKHLYGLFGNLLHKV